MTGQGGATTRHDRHATKADELRETARDVGVHAPSEDALRRLAPQLLGLESPDREDA